MDSMSSKRLKILFLSMEVPRMPGSGGQVRSWFFARALAGGNDLTLVSLGGFGGLGRVAPELAAQCQALVEVSLVRDEPPGPGNRLAAWGRAAMALLLPWRNRWQPFLEFHLQYSRRVNRTESSQWPLSRRLLAMLFRIEYDLLARLFPLPPEVVVLFRRNFDSLRPRLNLLLRNEEFDWIWFEHSLIYPFAAELKQEQPRAALACNAHNVESVLHRRIAETTQNLKDRRQSLRQAHLLIALERKAFATCDLIVPCSMEDAAAINALVPNASCEVIGNGVDTTYFQRRAEAPRSEVPVVLFTGSFGYRPNVEGLAWLVREVMPRVHRELPKTHFHIAGSSAGAALADLHIDDPRLVAISNPEDMRPCFEDAWIVAVPLLAGGGTRLKILEAMAMSCPLVSTSLGAEGIPLEPGRHALLADSPEAFADAVVDLLKSEGKRAEMAGAAMSFVRERYNWNLLTSNLHEILQSHRV